MVAFEGIWLRQSDERKLPSLSIGSEAFQQNDRILRISAADEKNVFTNFDGGERAASVAGLLIIRKLQQSRKDFYFIISFLFFSCRCQLKSFQYWNEKSKTRSLLWAFFLTEQTIISSNWKRSATILFWWLGSTDGEKEKTEKDNLSNCLTDLLRKKRIWNRVNLANCWRMTERETIQGVSHNPKQEERELNLRPRTP